QGLTEIVQSYGSESRRLAEKADCLLRTADESFENKAYEAAKEAEHVSQERKYEIDREQEAKTEAEAIVVAREAIKKRQEEAIIASRTKSVDFNKRLKTALKLQEAARKSHDKAADIHDYNKRDTYGYVAYACELASRCWNKAISAKTFHQSELVTLEVGAAEAFELEAAHYKESALACAAGHRKGGELWQSAAYFLNKRALKLFDAATAFEKAIQAKNNGEEELENVLKKSVLQNQTAAYYYDQVVEAIAHDDAVKEKCFKDAAEVISYRFKTWLERAACALEEARSIENPEVSTLGKTIARQYQMAADYSVQAAEAYAQGNEEVGKRLSKAAESASGENCLEYTLNILERKIKTDKKSEMAEKNRAAIALLHQAIEHFSQAAKAYSIGNENEGARLQKIGIELHHKLYS
ncbi:MAG TPA: hypothetical protein VJK54_11745, partial [Chthoniobacterales bacterium]|nr:hypothetical protein [Chthoniobacterales bacterium]